MPIYIANAYLVKNGKVVQPENEIELTEEQAKRLGDKVEAVAEEGAQNDGEGYELTETNLKKLTADEQKSLVEDLGGDLSELTNEEKRVEFILENEDQE